MNGLGEYLAGGNDGPGGSTMNGETMEQRDNVQVWVEDVRVKSAQDGEGGVYIAVADPDSDGDVYVKPQDLIDAMAFVNGGQVIPR